MRRTLFLDASNLYGGFCDLLPPGEYFEFASLLQIIERDLPVRHVHAYGTYMKERAGESASRARVRLAQKAFFNDLREHPKVHFHKGHFSGSGQEKGVDVWLALDMAMGAAKHEYDEAVIMCGDDDLTRAVMLVRDLGIPVHLAAFASRFPYGMSFHVNRRYVYDFNHFFERDRQKYRRRPLPLQVCELTPQIKVLKVA